MGRDLLREYTSLARARMLKIPHMHGEEFQISLDITLQGKELHHGCQAMSSPSRAEGGSQGFQGEDRLAGKGKESS